MYKRQPQNGGSMWTISGSIPMSRTAGSMSGTEAREIWPCLLYTSASTALAAMTRNLDSIYAAAGKPLYIEQLLYMDSTEAFSHNTQVEDEQVGEFVRNLAPVLSGRTNGYGLWVYRNYVNNAVYNSQFALDQEGWSFSGDSRIEERNGSKAAVIGQKGSISQDLDGRIPGSSRIHVEFYAEAENGEVYKRQGQERPGP